MVESPAQSGRMRTLIHPGPDSRVHVTVTPANIHDSQMLPRLLDPENEHDYVWADSAYSGESFENLLNLGGFESLIHEKGARNHPLSDAAKELNRIKTSIRASVEHVFGCMTMSMGGKLTRKIGLERNEAWWGLKNLAFNFLRYLQRSSHIVIVACIPQRSSQDSGDLVNG
jgi:IS5 family transposase